MRKRTVRRLHHFGNRLILIWGLLFACIVAAFPFYWMIVTAMQTGQDLFAWPPKFLPNIDEIKVFSKLFTSQPIGRWLVNSLIVGINASIASVVLSIFCAYSLSRFRFRGREAAVYSSRGVGVKAPPRHALSAGGPCQRSTDGYSWGAMQRKR